MSFGTDISQDDALAPDPGVGDPYVLKIFSTASVRASLEFARERVRRAGELPGAAAEMLARRWRAERARWAKRLRMIEAHNARVDLKARMLEDVEWRARVLHDLGGARGLARWERAWAKWRGGAQAVPRAAKQEPVWEMPSDAEFWADETEEGWEDESVEDEQHDAEDNKARARGPERGHGPRVDREGVFRWAAIPRGRRGETAEAGDAFAAKWGGRLERLARRDAAEAARRAGGGLGEAETAPERARGQARGCERRRLIPVSGDELRGELGEGFQEDFCEARPAGRELDTGTAAWLAVLEGSGHKRDEIGNESGARGAKAGEGCDRERFRMDGGAIFREPGAWVAGHDAGRASACEDWDAGSVGDGGSRSRIDRSAIFRENGKLLDRNDPCPDIPSESVSGVAARSNTDPGGDHPNGDAMPDDTPWLDGLGVVGQDADP